MSWQFSTASGFMPLPESGVATGCVGVDDSTYTALFAAQAKGAKITSASDGSPQAVDGNGAVIDLKMVASATTYAQQYTPTLSDEAYTALVAAKTYTQSEYTDFGDAIPDPWKTYLKALRDIANGTDTTSTALPAAPS